MPHSTRTDFDQAKIVLVVDQRRDDLGDTDERRTLFQFCQNLVDLEWTYDCAAGGFGAGRAVAKVAEGTWGRRQLEASNYGAAHIYCFPGETESIPIADWTTSESDFLLWSGVVSDVELTPKSDLVRLELMGYGEFLALGETDRSSATVGTIQAAAERIALEVANGTWIADTTVTDYRQVMSGGVLARNVLYREGLATNQAHLDNLVRLVGGHPAACYGVRNAGGADDLGQVYFSMVADPDREQTSSDADFDARSAVSVNPLELEEVSVRDDSSRIVNAVTVFRPWDGIEASNIIYEGSAVNTASVKRYGRRERTISDTSIEDRTQAADRAATYVAASSSPQRTVSASIVHDPRPVETPNSAGEGYLPLLSALKAGDTKVVIPFQERGSQDRADRGDITLSTFEPEISDRIVLSKGVSNSACLIVDCRSGSPSKSVPNAPDGRYSPAPLIDSGQDMDASVTVYEIQMKWTDAGDLADGGTTANSLAVWELDRRLFLVLESQGTTPQTYLPVLYYRDGTNTWTNAGAFTVFTGSTITKAQALAGLTFSLAIYTNMTGTTNQISGAQLRIYENSETKDDPTGTRTLLWDGTRSLLLTLTYSTEGDRVFFVNKVFGNGLGDGSSSPSLSRAVEIYGLTVYGTLGELNASNLPTFNGLLFDAFSDEIVYQQPLYKHANKRLLDTHIGCHRAVEADDVVGTRCKRLVHVAFAETGTFTDGGEYCGVYSGTTGTEVSAAATDEVRRHNYWLIGPGDTGFPAALGPDLAISVRTATCSLEGDKVRIELEGDGQPFSASYAIDQGKKQIDQLQLNQRIGAN